MNPVKFTWMGEPPVVLEETRGRSVTCAGSHSGCVRSSWSGPLAFAHGHPPHRCRRSLRREEGPEGTAPAEAADPFASQEDEVLKLP